MDLSSSDLELSLPQTENPCLIVEDSQPDSAALEDDPEGSYRTLLARRLSNLQPTSHSPVLELISYPAGNRCSQTDSPSEIAPSNQDTGPGGTSQFGFLELSESQGLGGEKKIDKMNTPQTDSQRCVKQAEDNSNSETSRCQGNNSKRSDVSSSSSLEPQNRTGRELSVQALLHSQGLSAENDDSELPSSQEDMFDKIGTRVDSTVSEQENQRPPTLTPAHTLQLLHLSGHGTLVQESLSQASVEFVAPTQDNLSQAPFIVPNSPTAQGNGNFADEPMDTSLSAEDALDEKGQEAMEMDPTPAPLPSASTPVSQNSQSFASERNLSVPSQPEFSHDVFFPTPTQSQEARTNSKDPQEAHRKNTASLQHIQKQTLTAKSSPSTTSTIEVQSKGQAKEHSVGESFQLELSVNDESCSLAQHTRGNDAKEDSQDTQIEGLDAPLGVDTSDCATSQPSQRLKRGSFPSSQPQTADPKAGRVSGSQKTGDECIPSQKSDSHKRASTTLNVKNVDLSGGASGAKAGSSQGVGSANEVSSSQQKLETIDLTTNSCVQETPSSPNNAPCSLASQSVFSQTHPADSAKRPSRGAGLCVDSRGGAGGRLSSQPSQEHRGPATPRPSLSPGRAATGNSQRDLDAEAVDEVMEEGEKQENTLGQEGSGLCLALSQSQAVSPEPMDEGEEGSCSVIVLEESERSSLLLDKEPTLQPRRPGSELGAFSSNGMRSPSQRKDTQLHTEQVSPNDRPGPEREGLGYKSLSDSSGEIPFHFTLPKEGELIGPAVSATPPLINQLKQTPRHSTPIEMASFAEKSTPVGGNVSTAMATSDIIAGESGEDTIEKGDGKLSLRMKLVTPVDEGNSEHFSLQKPPLSDDEGSVSKVTTVAKAVTSSPSVFSRVREANRRVAEEAPASGPGTPIRGELFGSPVHQRSSQRNSQPLGCTSLPGSQSEPSLSPQRTVMEKPGGPSTPGRAAVGPQVKGVEASGAAEPSTPSRTAARQKAVSQQTSFDNTVTPSKRAVSQQTSFDTGGSNFPTGRGEPETPPLRNISGPVHRKHIRTIQEVRTTVTRIITDVYYEDGKEMDRKVIEESEEPVVECRVLDGDISPCRTGSSMTSGDLGDVSSLSSKASSLQHSSGGTSSSTGPASAKKPDFIIPSMRGARSNSPRRGGRQHQRGHRGRAAGSEGNKTGGHSAPGSRALTPVTPRGRARRGRPPSRSSQARGGGAGAAQRTNPPGQPLSSSEDEPYTRMCPPGLPDSPVDPGLPSRSDSLRSSPEEGGSAGSSFVGLRVVAKWSSNGYFYSGRITKDAGEGRFRLRFDDRYECEVAAKDILLCDPIPMETEVTALLEDEYFSVGIVKGHKTEGQELFYNVEREGQRQWHIRSSVILSLEQGNLLREQHGLGPYEPSTPLAKASDISLDNLVEGKRRRRGNPMTPNNSSSGSPRTPGPSGKRKLICSEEERTPAKRGRRGGGRAGQRVAVCNTSGSGTDLPEESGDLTGTHGPLPQSTSLFMGFAFMLTASSEHDRLTNHPVSDGEEEYVQTAPYNKGYTENQLQAGGGFVLIDFNEEQCKAAYQSLLIADQHCRTRKYLQCVASGVPCVSHIWVKDCCKENKLLNFRSYLLPAGVGPDGTIVEWHPRCTPFNGLRALLVFEEPVELWFQLLTMSGAATVKHYQSDKDSSDVPEGKFDLVVTDSKCPPLVQKNVTCQKIPLVSAEWLIQSLVCGERLGYHSKPQYQHDYSSS
ncbi:TP53-binding protein 1 [Aplochiton taeniatus]